MLFIAALPIKQVEWITTRNWFWLVWLVLFLLIIIYNYKFNK